MTTEKKQFIAGAVCPKCGEEDSLVLFSTSKNIACVSCGFEQSSEQRDSVSNDGQQNNGNISTIKIIQLD